MTPGQTIVLRGKTKYGKDRIRRDGDVFVVKSISNNVVCLGGEQGAMIEPPNGNVRWIKLQNDTNFECGNGGI